MAQVFISYAERDRKFAEFVRTSLACEGIDVFMASISIEIGARWDERILAALRASPIVIFLGSEASNASHYVQQELGAAIQARKTILPIVWDMDPSNLPGMIRNIQALDLRGVSQETYAERLKSVAEKIHQRENNQALSGLIAVAILAAFLIYVSKA